MDRLLTTTEAADILGLTPGRVRQFAQEERIGRRLGNQWLFTPAELAAFKRRKRPSGIQIGRKP